MTPGRECFWINWIVGSNEINDFKLHIQEKSIQILTISNWMNYNIWWINTKPWPLKHKRDRKVCSLGTNKQKIKLKKIALKKRNKGFWTEKEHNRLWRKKKQTNDESSNSEENNEIISFLTFQYCDLIFVVMCISVWNSFIR